MGQILTHTSFDHEPFDFLPVIASFDRDGHIRPIYVGIQGESYKVHSYWIRRQFANSIEFLCKLTVRDHLQPLVITYHIKECLWTTPKIQ